MSSNPHRILDLYQMLFIDRTPPIKDFIMKPVNYICGFTYYSFFFFKLLIEERGKANNPAAQSCQTRCSSDSIFMCPLRDTCVMDSFNDLWFFYPV